MFDRYHRTVEETTELDLIPVMNLFMVLIPFLLMGAAFYHVGVIPTSLPAHTPNESDVPKTPTTVTVNLSISPTALELTASSSSLGEEALAKLGGRWESKEGKYDVAGLRGHLTMLKERYPKSDTMIVLPHPGLDYQALVGLLDGTRERPLPDDASAEQRAQAALFPVVVFSKLITAEATAEEASPEETP